MIVPFMQLGHPGRQVTWVTLVCSYKMPSLSVCGPEFQQEWPGSFSAKMPDDQRQVGKDMYFIKSVSWESFKNAQVQLITLNYWFCLFLLCPLQPTNNFQITDTKLILRLLHGKNFFYLLISVFFFSFSFSSITQRSTALLIPPK